MAAVPGMTLDITSGADGAAITTGNSTFSAVDSGPLVETDWAISPATRSMRCTTTGTATSMSGRLTGPSATTRYHGGAIYLRGPSGGATVIAEVRDESSVLKAQVQRQANGTFRLRNQAATAVGTVSSYIPDDTDTGEDGIYWLQLQITGSTFRAYLYKIGNFTPVWDSGSQTVGGGSFTRLSLGLLVGVANTDIGFSGWSADTTTPVFWASAPVVTCPSDVAADVATKVHLDASITDGSGTQAWTRLSGPTVTLSAPSAIDTDVYDPSGPGTTVLQLADGSSTDTVSITWSALPTTASVQGIESAGFWTDTANLLDVSEATKASVVNASASALGLRMANMATPSGDIAIHLGGVVLDGAHTVNVSIYKHDKSTLVKTVSGVSLSGGTMYIPMVAADIASMGTDWAHYDGWGHYLVLTPTAS